MFVKSNYSIVDIFKANVEKAKEDNPNPMKPQFYKHDKTEAEQLAETQPIIGKKTAARALEIQEEVDANMMNKHEQVGKVKPTIADERSDLRIVRGGDITANSNFGQSGINETDNDK